MMKRPLFSRLIAYLLFLVPCACAYSTEENFLLVDGVTSEVVLVLGPSIHERMTPCSTFKIALSLMGYDAGILTDETTPTWHFQEGYNDYLESWKNPQTPRSWISTSCVWYSRVLYQQLGVEKTQIYLALFDYGNQDMSGNVAWIGSSLQISPREQVSFIQKLIHEQLPVSSHAIRMTKTLLFKEDLPHGWRLFGKTGGGPIRDQNNQPLELGWFVGWIEKDELAFPFAYYISASKIDLTQRIPRVKQLLIESHVMMDRS